MNIEIVDPTRAEKFCTLFQHIKLFTNSVNITFNKDQMYLQTMDSTKVSVIEITLPNIWFDKYELVYDEPINIGINSNTLFKVLSTRDKSQLIKLHYDLENNDNLYIHFLSGQTKMFDKHFNIPLLELDTELVNIPDIESNADITLSSTNFSEIINQLQLFGDTIEFKCTEEQIQLCSVSTELGKIMADISIDDLNSYSIIENYTMHMSFSLNKLHNICMFNKIAKEVDILLTDEYPMQITYNLGLDNANLNFYLAPIINE